MRTTIALAAALTLSCLPAHAQQKSPGQAAIDSADACIKTKAATYAEFDLNYSGSVSG